MSIESYRVFISYRGASEGMAFGQRLYDHLTADPMCLQRYGNIYFSPRTKSAEVNFKLDVPEIMRDVRYFIMPLSRNYFSDFWDEEKGCPDSNSITYIEINEAIKNNCRFICISFPGFKADAGLFRKLFGDRADELLCLAPLEYDPGMEMSVIQCICDILYRKEQENRGMAQLLEGRRMNVALGFKEDTEHRVNFPFYEILHDVKKITLLNFASSSFIAGIDIASVYEENDDLKRWFSYHLIHGKIEATVVLTNPHSYAAQDAALFKMYPEGLTREKDEIIPGNMNKLFKFISENPAARLNVHLTDIVLPYGLMITEHHNPANDHIKVDLYAPVISNDKKRPSFYLLKSDRDTRELYTFFEENVRKIINDHSFAYKGHPDTRWLRGKSIAHRGLAAPGLTPHTQGAYDACLAAKLPIEVDLLVLSDGTIAVGRAEETIVRGDGTAPLGACSGKDLRRHNKKAGILSKFTLADFLEYIHGRIPILLEIKEPHGDEARGAREENVRRILRVVQDHLKRCSYPQEADKKIRAPKVAFHSSDPDVLRQIREADCMIPCGIISMDFSRIREVVGEDFCRIHAQAEYLNTVTPDFISYNVKDLDNGLARRLKERLGIPLLGWTVTDEDGRDDAADDGCDSIIAEGGIAFR